MTLCRGVHSEVSQAQTIIVRNPHFVTTGAVMMLPAILSCTRFALEREAKTRSRFVVFVESLVPNFVEELSKRARMLNLTFTAAALFFLSVAATSFPLLENEAEESCRAS